jgi:TfoX/Sxy family transcriptional regulator of competence genes
MAYDEYLQERIESVLNEKHVGFEARKMMGGLCFMIDNKMCLGIVKSDLMARVGVDNYKNLIKVNGARPMDFTKRPMKGFVYVSPEGVDLQEDLEFWIEKALEFNPFAKASKSRKKSKK